jgi:tetratricopeptide (TPR) repeat protein
LKLTREVGDRDETRPRHVTVWRSLALALAIMMLGAFGRAGAAEDAATASYVGVEACAACHQAETKLWRGSHHDLAMQHVNETSVLGDFNNTSFEHFGVRSRFFRDGAKYLVETDGADGKLATFEIKFTFGVEPLQQYLVEFPDGRLQPLPIAWDSRPKDKGGQRWFHLYPDERIGADDELHWTKLAQNWNFMCASCHTTNLHKNFDAKTDTFRTTYSEINVACEACHGPGSRHVDWAKAGANAAEADKGLIVGFNERANANWTRAEGAPSPHRAAPPAALRKEVETCGLCHARAAELKEDWIPGHDLSESHLVTPIERQLYTADGQMIDHEETYNYVPFKQSRMFAAGVTCSDCHDPHSAKLRVSPTQTCLSCHSAELATSAHTHHEKADGAPECVSCHMPAHSYMVVDVRHDHSFRIPRPDLSVALGTPNACNDCHRDKDAQWAKAAVEKWFGPQRKGFQTYAPAFHAAWNEDRDAEALLTEAAKPEASPAVARASALSALEAYPSAAAINTARASLSDPDPMVRIGALDALAALPVARTAPLIAPRLSDPALAVRLHAVSELATAKETELPPADRDAFLRAAAEFEATQRLNADRPEARATLAGFYVVRGKLDEAEQEYLAALKQNPLFTPAAIGLADIYRQRGQSDKAIYVLKSAAAAGGGAAAHHALGLELVRAKRYDEALAELKRAVELAPDDSRFAYVYAVALHSLGQGEPAMAEIDRALKLHPYDRELLSGALSFHREAGDLAGTLAYAERLAALVPDDAQLAAFVASLKQRMKQGQP